MTATQRAMMKDPSFPDVPVDADGLLSGDLSDIRGHVQLLIKHLAHHQDIDRDVWHELSDASARMMAELDDVLCLRCLAAGAVRIGRGRGFDERKCDACQRLERAL